MLQLELPVADVGLVVDEPELEQDRNISAELREQIEAELQERFDARIAQGQQQVIAERAQLAQTQQALTQAAAQLSQLQEQALEELRNQGVDLALAIARKVIAQEIKAQRVEIDPIVIDALRQLPARGEIEIHLNPADLERSQFVAEATGAHARELKFVSDPDVAPGGCVVQSVEGSVESNIDSSLQKIGEVLRDTEEGE